MPLSAPTIVLTGATSGIGRCAAIALARQGANLVLTARSQERADATVAIIKAAAPGNDPKAQRALWQATAERVAAFSRDEAVERDVL